MSLRRDLLRTFAVRHPAEAAADLEKRSDEGAAQVLSVLPDNAAADVLKRMSPGAAARLADVLPVGKTTAVFALLPHDTAATLLRRTAPDRRDAILAGLPEEPGGALRTLLRYPRRSAGALMDPRAPSLPDDLTAEAALAALRRDAQDAIYNVYIVDREGRLTGVVNLQELLSAPPLAPLARLAKPPRLRLAASADSREVVSHPGWAEVYSLPVVDDAGRFLGAIRYRTYRRIEKLLREGDHGAEAVTVSALGDLFLTGMNGVISALSLIPESRSRNDDDAGGAR